MLPKETPPIISNSTLFGWIMELYCIDDETIISYAGFDNYFLIRFYRMSFKIVLCIAVYAWGVLIPING